MNIYKQMIHFNQQQTLSISLSMLNMDMAIIIASTINSSFTRLESLSIGGIELEILLPLLSRLASLPRLFSLTINRSNTYQRLNNCYALIFKLPKLKFLKLSVLKSEDFNGTIGLPMPSSQSSTVIKYLVIDHPCISQDLSNILLHTLELSHLNVTLALTIKDNFPIMFPLSNLTNLSIELPSMSFDEFEILISKIDAKLRVLRY